MFTLPLLLTVAAGVFGAMLGSFINALSFRYNTGVSILHGRSRCMQCNHTLSALDLVPIFSYLLLGGKCRYCGSKISLQYPIVECVAALLGVLVYTQHPFASLSAEAGSFIYWLLVWMTLLFIVVYDMRHTIIPWSCSGLLAVLAIIYLATGHWDTLSLMAGPLLALPLFLLSLISRGTWMGWGDSALEISLGWLLGLSLGASALMFAFWSGAIVGVLLIVAQKVRSRFTPTTSSQKAGRGLTMNSEIPFAPFLVFGAALAYFFHVNLFSSISLFF